MDRILFIVQPYISFDRFVKPSFNERAVKKKSGATFGSAITDMPIGLLSLSSYVKGNADAEVKAIDFNLALNRLESYDGDSFRPLYRQILSDPKWRDFNPTIVGLSTNFTPAYHNMIDVAEIIRELFPEALIIAGGGIPTNMPKEVFRDSQAIDALCYGEGERPLLELVQAAPEDRQKVFDSHKSWMTRERVAAEDTFAHDFIDDLDEIPFYDYTIVDPEEYGMSPTLGNYAAFETDGHLFHVATSRGCPHLCIFCASHTVHGRKMRYHSVERVTEDFKRLRDQYGAVTIGIQDDMFMANKKRALAIINMAADLDLTLFFQSGVAMYQLDTTMLEAMKRAGLKELVLPIESGSERVLRKVMKKPSRLSIIQQVVSDCRALEIDTDANVLIGLPGETKEDIQDTLTFLKTVDATWFRVYVATPLVGSEMLEICVEKGYLEGDEHIGSDFKNAIVETEHFTAEYIVNKAYEMNLELNFVNNADFRLGNFKRALRGFENTISIKDDHAFAYYFAGKCYEMMGMQDSAQAKFASYQRILETSEMWRDYAVRFDLPTSGQLTNLAENALPGK